MNNAIVIKKPQNVRFYKCFLKLILIQAAFSQKHWITYLHYKSFVQMYVETITPIATIQGSWLSTFIIFLDCQTFISQIKRAPFNCFT